MAIPSLAALVPSWIRRSVGNTPDEAVRFFVKANTHADKTYARPGRAPISMFLWWERSTMTFPAGRGDTI
jgi:hypothetical protein